MNARVKTAMLAAAVLSGIVNFSFSADRPNILWITSEDNGAFLGCYGDANARTPNLDRLAERGIRYTRCYANAPVCAVARSSLILGFPAPTSGMHHMRCKIQLPQTLVPYPSLLKRAGYYVTNNAKTYYNTRSFDKDIWDECGGNATYQNRAPGQPFFAVFNLEQTHEGQIFEQHYGNPPRNWDVNPKTPADGIVIPPYQTATPENILNWRRMYDKISEMDGRVGAILQKLEQSGESENTIVVYCADHGGITLRSKRYLYDSGVRVPMLAAFPPKWQHLAPDAPGSVSDRLVQFIDMPRTFLSLAGVEPPDVMTGRIFLGPDTEPAPETVFLFSNRFDEAPDTRRGITDGRWKLIRNYEPDRPRFQMLFFPWHQAGQPAQWRVFAAGRTTPAQSAQFLPQSPVELYDTLTDPHEVHNLAADPAAARRLSTMQKQLDEQILATRDLGFLPEPLSARVDRERGQTIYNYGQSDANYPLQEILAMATLASAQNVDNLPHLRKGVVNANPTVRYWAMVGLRALGKEAAPAASQVEDALKDPELSVRLTAMVCRGNLGHKEEAAQLLLNEARSAKTDVDSLWALDGIKFLGMEAVVKTVPSKEIAKGHYSERTCKFLKAGGNMQHPVPFE